MTRRPTPAPLRLSPAELDQLERVVSEPHYFATSPALTRLASLGLIVRTAKTPGGAYWVRTTSGSSFVTSLYVGPDGLDVAAALLTGEPTQAGVDRYEREVLASQARAPDYYELAKAEMKRLGLTREQYVGWRLEQMRGGK